MSTEKAAPETDPVKPFEECKCTSELTRKIEDYYGKDASFELALGLNGKSNSLHAYHPVFFTYRVKDRRGNPTKKTKRGIIRPNFCAFCGISLGIDC